MVQVSGPALLSDTSQVALLSHPGNITHNVNCEYLTYIFTYFSVHSIYCYKCNHVNIIASFPTAVHTSKSAVYNKPQICDKFIPLILPSQARRKAKDQDGNKE